MPRSHITAAPSRRRASCLVAGLVLLLGGAACGGGDDDASDEVPTSAPDTTVTTAPEEEAPDEEAPEEDAPDEICDIVSDEVVLEVLEMDDLERREPNGDLTQTYGCIKGTDRVDDLSTGSYVSVSFIKGGAAVVDQFASEPASVSVTGYGDKAVYVPDAGALSIAVGADSYQIQVVKGGRPSDQADATIVADDVLG